MVHNGRKKHSISIILFLSIPLPVVKKQSVLSNNGLENPYEFVMIGL